MMFISAAAVLFSASALAVPTPTSDVAVKISQSGVQTDEQVSNYIGAGGVYATFRQEGNEQNLSFTKDAKKAEKFKPIPGGSGGPGTVLKGSHGYLSTTQAPQGFGGVFFQATVDADVQLIYTPGATNNRHLTDREDGFSQWMFCYSPEGTSLSWTKVGFNLEQYNKDLPDQGTKDYHCAYVTVDVVEAPQCH